MPDALTLTAPPTASGAEAMCPENRVKALDVLSWPRVGVRRSESPDRRWGNRPRYDGKAVGSVLARYYDPTTGQLLSIDPDVAITDTPYAYVIGDPVNATDASGKIPIALGGCGNPHNLAACVAAARRSGTMKGLTLKQVWTWIYSNRGMIVSVVAIGICVAAALPTAGGSLAVCGVASLVASGVRIQQRIAENGFMASLPANSADLFISSLTFGMVDTPTGLGSADVGAVGAAGLRLHSALPSIFNAATYQLERR